MRLRNFALIYGIVFLIVGIAGFIPALVTPPTPQDPDLAMPAGHGHLFGLFAVNVVHNIVHVIFGIWGLAVYRSISGSLTYARAVAVIYALLVIMGLFPALRTTFGMVPLYGNDVWLHLALAVIAAYFGFFHHKEELGTPSRV